MKPRARKEQDEIFVWSRKYQVGIVKVDKQHKRLVDLINTLARKMEDDSDPSLLMQVFDELASYAAYHFKAEEGLMQEWQVDPVFEKGHRDSHASFIREVSRARLAAREHPQQVTTRTLTFLSRWLILHILGTDMRMANEIIALEKGLSPEEARARAQAKAADSNEVLLQAMGELYETLAARTHDAYRANRQLKEEIALHEAAEKGRQLLLMAIEHSPAATFITNAEGVFQYVNPTFTELTGYAMPELVGQTPRILKSGAMPEEAYADFWRCISGKNEWFGEFHNKRKDGSTYWARASVTPIADGDGNVTHYLTIQEDVTGKKLLEDELKQSHARLLAASERQQGQTEDFAGLNEAFGLLETCLTEEEARAACARMAERMALGSGGSLALAEPNEQAFTVVATWGQDPAMAPGFQSNQCWALRRGLAHETFGPDKGLTCSHYRQEAGAPSLCLPLLARGRALGVLHICLPPDADQADRDRAARLGTALGKALMLTLRAIRLESKGG